MLTPQLVAQAGAPQNGARHSSVVGQVMTTVRSMLFAASIAGIVPLAPAAAPLASESFTVIPRGQE